VGDCFDDIMDSHIDLFLAMRLQPCNLPHDSEVFAVVTMPGESDTAYPTMDAFADGCHDPFNTYVGLSYVLTSLSLWRLLPNEQSWNGGSRLVVCYLGGKDGRPLVGSMRNSFR
jgi:hypothetical protein